MNEDIFKDFLEHIRDNPWIDNSMRTVARRSLRLMREREEQMKPEPDDPNG